MKNGDIFLYNLLVESNNVNEKYFNSLTEEVRVDTIKDIANTVIGNIMSKVNNIDMTLVDRSRGDIKSLRELQTIQEVVTKLEAMLDKADAVYPDCKRALTTIIKSILYLNQYSQYFKEAYRTKKTVLILKYQSIVLSVISATTYLMAVMVDPENLDNLKLNKQIYIDAEIAPLRTLDAFVKSVDSGEFKITVRDVNIVRENFVELSGEDLGKLLESSEVVDMVVNGLKNFKDSLGSGDRIASLLYKAVGVVLILFSVRDIIYTVCRNRTKTSDMVSGMQGFLNKDSKVGSFLSRFTTSIESASEIADREISDEDKTFSTQIKQVPKSAPIVASPVQDITATAAPTELAAFDSFDF